MEFQKTERANNFKSEFLSRMSHELRTPLNAIFGFAQLLQTNEEEPLSQTQEHDIAEIIKASQQLLEMINQLLDLSRIENGQVEQDTKIINVSKLVADYVYQISRSVASAKQITIRNQISDPDLYLLADPSCFRQIMTNLISNAIKYNHDGGAVTIDSVSSNHNTWLRIQISDTGPGISQSQISKLFKPFERLSAGDTEIEGIGIGLSVTKLLVEAMGGDIGVDSIPGQGSTFWFELPLTRKTETAPNRAAEILPLAPSTQHHLKVLYIEDNPSNLKLVREYLERHKHITMITARTAEQGLELAETRSPDLILMDIGLPGIDGYQALEILQTVETTRNIPVVAISANALPIDIEKGLAAGFKTYLTKPISLEQLTDTIEQVLAA